MKKKEKNKDNIINFPQKMSPYERKVEAILFAASEPLDIETISNRLKNNINVEKILLKIQKDYKKRGINLVSIKGRWSFRTAEDLSSSMALQKSAQRKLSKARAS